MKRIVIILFIIYPLAIFAKVATQNVDSLFVAANKFYSSGKYTEAVQHYEAIIAKGKVSPELYFNLGNAYFKLNDMAHAILNYERAYLLNPSDDDIKFNLELARTYTTDKIEAIPDFFVTKWINQLSNLFSSNTWALLALLSFIITLVLLSLFQFSGRYQIKKNSFWFSWVLGALFIVFILFSNVQKNRVVNSNHAIITTSSVAVKSSPSDNSNDLFILHAGTKVETLRNVGDWCEIKIADGSKGWLLKSNFEKI
ncbi:tetratricopeptide repeat protein [Tenuifilum thalassicum]|uniref:Tetratricopeptide repeat protein n=1 Tax=Tenuifilum thalassicum TaxID=2590900 RepID=A0A7D3XVN9_9BACT|nr:tetratricopeptide repeat protein [Tenuifilum thalassicum]QKG80008.1 tetratricopeptide repeat protein [Tenuifilum thalassicum]